MKRGIGFKRRFSALCSLLVLHGIGMAGNSVLAADVAGPGLASMVAAQILPAPQASPAPQAAMPAGHCADASAMPAAAAANATTHASSDCSGCCKVQHACPGACACTAAPASVTSPLPLAARVVPLPAPDFIPTAPPPQPPLRIFRPPIA